MRKFLIPGAVVVVVFAMWLVAGRWCALLIDELHTTRLATLGSYSIGWDGSWFRFGAGIPGSLRPSQDPWLSPYRWDSPEEMVKLRVEPDGSLVIMAAERRFVLGKRAGMLSGNDSIPAFEPEPGDTTSITLDLSVVSWPIVLDVNWMGGQSPSWRRYLYCRLTSVKSSGARLDMLWRYEQGYFREGGWGWANPMGGLVRADIRPAAAP